MDKIRVKLEAKPSYVNFNIPIDDDGKIDLGNNIRVSKEVLMSALQEWIKNAQFE